MQDNKPAVISLQRLIVREVAHDDKAMFLICACTTSLPEMYEIHTGSKEECVTWTALIREAVESYPQEELQRELIAKLQECQDDLKEKDDQIIQCLTEKKKIFDHLYKSATGQETPHKGLLLQADATELQGGTLLEGAIKEVENLLNLFALRMRDPNLLMEESQVQEGLHRQAETSGVGDSDSHVNTMKNGDVAEWSSSSEDIPVYISHTAEICYSEGLEQSADDDTLPEPDCSPASSHFPEAEVCERLMRIEQFLYSLKAIVAQQDSQIELQHAFQSSSQKSARHYSNMLLEQEKQRNLEKQKEELANLHKQQAQHQEEQQRWEKERDRQRIQLEALEAQLQQREADCNRQEEKLNGEKAELECLRENYQQDLERLRESTKSVEKEREQLIQEKERLDKLKSKYIPGHANYDDPTQCRNHSTYLSFRGSIVNGGGNPTLTPKPSILLPNSDPMEIPPKVPPRRESISPQLAKPELPVHLFSTTNQVHKPPAVQQQIPTKLATQPKGKEKGFKTKGSHHRTQSAASIDVNQVLPIRVTGKEGGSLRAKRNASPQRIYQSDTFKPPGSGHNVKTSQSFSTHKRSSSEARPPAPPPFPKDVLETGKEKVIFL
uniref:Rho/rac guanine nucleotide exchange factor (GEF) 18a n=1 Tax=Lates calcarifer TaxID=8187 RepID=A0A4W6E8X2_LATCA